MRKLPTRRKLAPGTSERLISQERMILRSTRVSVHTVSRLLIRDYAGVLRPSAVVAPPTQLFSFLCETVNVSWVTSALDSWRTWACRCCCRDIEVDSVRRVGCSHVGLVLMQRYLSRAVTSIMVTARHYTKIPSLSRPHVEGCCIHLVLELYGQVFYSENWRSNLTTGAAVRERIGVHNAASSWTGHCAHTHMPRTT